jgi:rubredoxin-NAD+ reductase
MVRKSRKVFRGCGIIQTTQGKPKSNSKKQEENIMKYICDVCGWEYDEELGYPEGGIAPGTKWEDVPADFECPLCMVGKDEFSAE